jgi:hypothetical protein
MNDARFEVDLIRRFAEPARFADAAQFADALDRRLRRVAIYRRAALTLAGAGGALIAVTQVLISGQAAAPEALSQVQALAQDAWAQISGSVRLGLGDLPLGGEVFWLAMGMAALAAALFIGRLRADD